MNFYDRDNFKFNIEDLIDERVGLTKLTFPKMDKSKAPVCKAFLNGKCNWDEVCPHRHINNKANTVCKHYLNGLCKKGDACEFLHSYDMSKMADCHFDTPEQRCQNEDCPYNHRKKEVISCPWYDRGFCKNGLQCTMKHELKVMCKNFMNGLCLEGENCPFAHPRWFPLPNIHEVHKQTWICRNCNGRGHKIQFCNLLSAEDKEKIRIQIQIKNSNLSNPRSDWKGCFFNPKGSQISSEIICFKCGEKGHKSNVCNKFFA